MTQTSTFRQQALGRLSVCLVEPSAMQSKIIIAELAAAGVADVRHVQTGAEALESLRRAPAELLISALYLPDMSGTDLVTAMRGDPTLEKTGFILVSSETRPQALEPVRQSGICAILPKPFSREQLQHALDNSLELLEGDATLNSQVEAEHLRVLLVDDSPSARRFMRRVLENLGITRFVEAENGREAAAILVETQVDLVVTDYNMPEMDGEALVRHIRSKGWQQSVPILMVTSEHNEARLAAVENAGVSGICDKPFEPEVVKALLWNMLGK
ncbi:MAG: response regulator [Rhodocyclaceae bacterium]|nr:response regulator [Rhodocyclaceae bacterium]